MVAGSAGFRPRQPRRRRLCACSRSARVTARLHVRLPTPGTTCSRPTLSRAVQMFVPPAARAGTADRLVRRGARHHLASPRRAARAIPRSPRRAARTRRRAGSGRVRRRCLRRAGGRVVALTEIGRQAAPLSSVKEPGCCTARSLHARSCLSARSSLLGPPLCAQAQPLVTPRSASWRATRMGLLDLHNRARLSARCTRGRYDSPSTTSFSPESIFSQFARECSAASSLGLLSWLSET